MLWFAEALKIVWRGAEAGIPGGAEAGAIVIGAAA